MRAFSRREALVTAAGVSAVTALSGEESMPVVHWGPHTISRLIVGGNPVSGTSHFSPTRSERAKGGNPGQQIGESGLKPVLGLRRRRLVWRMPAAKSPCFWANCGSAAREPSPG